MKKESQNNSPCFLTIAMIEYFKAKKINKHDDSDYVKKQSYEEYERQIKLIAMRSKCV